MLLHFVPDVAVVATSWTDAADTVQQKRTQISSHSVKSLWLRMWQNFDPEHEPYNAAPTTNGTLDSRVLVSTMKWQWCSSSGMLKNSKLSCSIWENWVSCTHGQNTPHCSHNTQGTCNKVCTKVLRVFAPKFLQHVHAALGMSGSLQKNTVFNHSLFDLTFTSLVTYIMQVQDTQQNTYRLVQSWRNCPLTNTNHTSSISSWEGMLERSDPCTRILVLYSPHGWEAGRRPMNQDIGTVLTSWMSIWKEAHEPGYWNCIYLMNEHLGGGPWTKILALYSLHGWVAVKEAHEPGSWYCNHLMASWEGGPWTALKDDRERPLNWNHGTALTSWLAGREAHTPGFWHCTQGWQGEDLVLESWYCTDLMAGCEGGPRTRILALHSRMAERGPRTGIRVLHLPHGWLGGRPTNQDLGTALTSWMADRRTHDPDPGSVLTSWIGSWEGMLDRSGPCTKIFLALATLAHTSR